MIEVRFHGRGGQGAVTSSNFSLWRPSKKENSHKDFPASGRSDGGHRLSPLPG